MYHPMQMNNTRNIIKNRFDSQMTYLQKLEDLGNDDYVFLQKFSHIFKKYLSFLDDPTLRDATRRTLENWLSSNDIGKDGDNQMLL